MTDKVDDSGSEGESTQVSSTSEDNEETKPQVAESKTEYQVVPSAPRENLVSTAVHFLQNTKVQASPLSQKRAFLLKKGLTNEEIDLAIERAQVTSQAQSSHQIPSYPVPSQPPVPVIHTVAKPTPWETFRNVSSSIVVVGVACYGLYYLYKRYIQPLISGKGDEEDRIDQIQKHLGELTGAVQQLKGSINSIEETLNAQKSIRESESIEIIKQDVSLSDLKNEVSSIKALLLSRKQFPSNPVTTPTIPSWQLKNEVSMKPEVETIQTDTQEAEANHSHDEEEEEVKLNGVANSTAEVTVEQ